MKFYLKFKRTFWLFFIFIAIIATVIIVINSFRLFNLSGHYSSNPVIETISTVFASVVLLTLILIVMASKVKFSKTKLKIFLGLLAIYKIDYADITNVREFKNEKELIIGYLRKNGAPAAINILINPEGFELFTKSLRKKNNGIISDIKKHK